MRAKTWTPAIVVAGLLGTGLSGVEVAGQAPASRAERLRRETDNVALQNVAPFKVFDNLYYVGEKMLHGASPSAWAITTSEGIILIDALFGNSVEDEIVGGLKKMKLDPADLKYLILSHGHADHIGGATGTRWRARRTRTPSGCRAATSR
ncbi:MAG: hypothetical protein DMF88_22270 [Acidobacteria bacterium]|nr:MAG: hypothetical protein DMF88_22270 [Acidobacteriota bacterium]